MCSVDYRNAQAALVHLLDAGEYLREKARASAASKVVAAAAKEYEAARSVTRSLKTKLNEKNAENKKILERIKVESGY